MAAPLRAGVLALVIAAGAAGCGDDGDGAPPSCLPECPASRGYDAQGYHLRARFDAEARVMHASEDITLAYLDTAIAELDAEVDITGVHAGDQPLAYAYDEEAHLLRVDLGPLIGDNTPVTFTVDYTAPTSDALVYGGPRDDDPVPSRVLFTDSEPDRGRRWLIANHDPSDRAQFAVELTVAAGDDVIGNGARLRDDTVGGERTVGYALAAPIPTYIMAFAAGALDHTDRAGPGVPLSVWYRRGLVLDPAATLDAVGQQMAFFEERLGPYPFDSYAVVLLPQFGGGMENATITFNAETAGQGVIHFSLNAHELAHQWFGDHVTMRTYDDLWTKEGMATFLESEAQLAFRDRGRVGRMFGSDFLFLNSTAVVDPALEPIRKYTDGPYGRAAWVISQIRRVVGEEAFWAGLRKILAEHALADISSEDFVRAFSPALDEPTIQKVLASLLRHDGAELHVTTVTQGAALDVRLELDDAAGVVIAPLDVTVVDAAGATAAHLVSGSQAAVFTVPAGGYVAPDEHGVHPSWARTFDAAGADLARLSARTAPASSPASPALAAFLGRGPAHQERAIFGALQVPPGAELATVYDALDSDLARESLLVWTCSQLVNLGEPAALIAALEPLLEAPPLARYNTGFMRCPTDLAARVHGAELAALAAAPTGANIARLEYLLGFDYGTATNFARLTGLATSAPSLRLRERALSRMVAETTTGAPRRVPEADRPAWRAFFRGQYPLVKTSARFGLVWQGSVNLADLEALPVVAPMLHSVPMSEGAQRQVVCDAHRMTRELPAAWAAFQEAARPWETLAPAASAALANRATCDAARAWPAAWSPELVDDGDERGRLHGLR